MNVKTRLWILGTVLICGAFVLLGVTGGLLPQLTAATSTEMLADSTEQQNEAQQAQLTRLQNAKQNGDELAATLADLRKALPDTAASTDWVSELRSIENSSKAVVTEFKLPNPLLGAAGSAQANPPKDGAAAGNTTAASGPQTIPFTLKVTGSSRAEVADFLRRLQTGDRLVLISKVKLLKNDAATDGSTTDSGAEAAARWTGEFEGVMYTELDG